MDKTIRPRGNIVSLFNEDEVRAFIRITSGITDDNGKRIFVPMGQMSNANLRTAYTGETTEPHEIFIWHRGNYRPCHSDNITYLNKAIHSLRVR